MKNLRRLAQLIPVGHVQPPKKLPVQFLITSVALFFHQCFVEVHVYQPLVDLDDAVLQSCGDLQLVLFGAQNEIGLHRSGDADTIKRHQCPQTCGNNRAGTGQTHPVRNVGIVADGKILVMQIDLVAPAIITEPFYRRLQQPDAAIITMQLDVSDPLSFPRHRVCHSHTSLSFPWIRAAGSYRIRRLCGDDSDGFFSAIAPSTDADRVSDTLRPRGLRMNAQPVIKQILFQSLAVFDEAVFDEAERISGKFKVKHSEIDG